MVNREVYTIGYSVILLRCISCEWYVTSTGKGNWIMTRKGCGRKRSWFTLKHRLSTAVWKVRPTLSRQPCERKFLLCLMEGTSCITVVSSLRFNNLIPTFTKSLARAYLQIMLSHIALYLVTRSLLHVLMDIEARVLFQLSVSRSYDWRDWEKQK
jgi:hypothetical protein